MRYLLAIMMVFGLAPGLGELVETAVHLATSGHLAHTDADQGDLGSTSITVGGMGGGMMGGTMMQPTAGTTGLATAMTTFVGSSMNKSGVQMAVMQPLIDRLNTSTGTIQ